MKKNLCCFLSSLVLICVLYISLSSSQKAEYIKKINGRNQASKNFIDSHL